MIVRVATLLFLLEAASAKAEPSAQLLQLLTDRHQYDSWPPHAPPRTRFQEDHYDSQDTPESWPDATSGERSLDYGSQDENDIFEHLNDDDDDGSTAADKRSAVMAALTAGGRRLRRVPAPQHASKAVGPIVEIGGVLDSLGDFMGSLRHNLKAIHDEDVELRHAAAPSVVQGGGGSNEGYQSGGGGGSRKLYALRPLHPNMHTRSYDRRSFVGAGSEYRGANHHDPGLLWTGLGRRRRR